MATTDTQTGKKDVIAPKQDTELPARYYEQHTWVLDSTTLSPVGVRVKRTFS